MKKINLLIWNLVYALESENQNAGDKTILASMISTLKNSIPNAEISIFSNDVNVVKEQFGVRAVKYSFRNILNVLKAIWKSDVFIFGGGEVVIDKSSYLHLPFMLHLSVVAKILGKPVVAYAIGVGDLDEISDFGKLLSRFILNKFDLITVRDPDSKKILNCLGVTKPPTYITADPAANLQSARVELVEKVLAQYGIAGSGETLIGLSPRQPIIGIKGSFLQKLYNILPVSIRVKFNLVPPSFSYNLRKFEESIAKLADHLVEKYNAKLVFIPMFSGPKISYRDDVVSLEILKSMKKKEKAVIISTKYPAYILKGIFGKMDLVIGMPLHSIILASVMNVPVIGIAYAAKVERFLRMLNYDEQNFIEVEDLDQQIDLEDLLLKIDKVWTNRAKIMKEISEKVESIKNQELNNIVLLRSYLESL